MGRKFWKQIFKRESGDQVVGSTQRTGSQDCTSDSDAGDAQALSAEAPRLPQDEGTEGGVSAFHGAQDVQLQFQNSNVNTAGRDIYNIITHIHYHELKDDIKAILDAVTNYRKIQQDTLARSTPGTIQWFFKWKEFEVFIDINGNLKILWGSGMPGAGKTIFASIVIDQLEKLAEGSDGHICVCYAYIRYSDQDQVTLRGILEALVKQTIERHADCAAIVQKAFAIHAREKTRPTEEELLSLLRQFCETKKTTFYILDALDEAPSRVRLRLLQKLSSTRARLFMTSRPLPDLEAEFPSACCFSITANDLDLDLHISEKIRESSDLRGLLERSGPDFREHLAQTVKAKCGGMFLHASLQLDALQDCFTAHDAMQTLEAFPRKIEDVYRHTWKRIINSDSAYHSSLAKAAFTWVLNAQRSLTADELCRALATCPDTYHFEEARLMPEATILAACRGLITIDKESKLVRLVHYTAKEPLTALLLSYNPHPHALLAAVCATLLADHGFQNTTFSDEWELQKSFNKPLLGYAYLEWAFHTQQSLQSDLTAKVVAEFVSGCGAFPLGDGKWIPNFDTIQRIHVVARYNLPFTYAGPCEADAVNSFSVQRAWTPLMFASRHGHEEVILPLLALPNIQVNLPDLFGRTALSLASHGDHEGSVKLLLAHPDTQVNLAYGRGITPLILASMQGCEGTVRLLLAHPDIKVNMAKSNGKTALIYASRGGHEGVVKLLLQVLNININTVTRDNEAAIKFAAEEGHENVVRLLLEVPGIDTSVRSTADGHTAMSVAQANGYHGIVRLLEEFEAR